MSESKSGPAPRAPLELHVNALVAAALASQQRDKPDDALTGICRSIRRLLDADGACVTVREGESVHYLAEDAIGPLWAGQSFPISECISGWSIEHQSGVAIRDIHRDDRIRQHHYDETFVHSLAVQPFGTGAISAYWRSNHRASATERGLLKGIAAVCSLHLEIVKLCQERDEYQRRAQVLLAMVAHELRGNLNVVQGWASVADREESDSVRRHRAMSMVRRALDQENLMIEDLLDKSFLSADSFRMTPRETDLGALLREAVEQIRPMSESSGLHVHMRPAMPHVELVGDPVRLQQAVMNLLTNACKFGKAGGNIWIDVQGEESEVLLTVSDDGRGIAPEDVGRIFDPFFRASDDASSQHAGIGLGLAIVYRIVRAHGGAIEASSPGLGKGSRFSMRIPTAVGGH